MKAKTKYRICGILYLIMCMFSMYLIDAVFMYFSSKPSIYAFTFLAVVSFAWWTSISGMCKYIVYLRFIQIAEEQVKKNDKQK